MVAKTAARRQEEKRRRFTAQGKKRYEFWLKESEALKVLKLVLKLRKVDNPT